MHKRVTELQAGDRIQAKGKDGFYYPTTVLSISFDAVYVIVHLISLGEVHYSRSEWVEMVDPSLDTLSALAPESRLQPETANTKQYKGISIE